jgi:hypothetical protein
LKFKPGPGTPGSLHKIWFGVAAIDDRCNIHLIRPKKS